MQQNFYFVALGCFNDQNQQMHGAFLRIPFSRAVTLKKCLQSIPSTQLLKKVRH